MSAFDLDLCGNPYSRQDTYFGQYNPHPRELWLQQGLDYGRLCDENHYNMGIKIHKQYLAHASDAQRRETIADLRHKLSQTVASSLVPRLASPMSLRYFPLLIRHMARYLEERTLLDEMGAALCILTATAAACCGRVVIQINDSYSQPFILQLLGISESGTRKSDLKREICLPIYDWTDEANTGTQVDGKLNAIKADYAKKFFQQRGRQILSKEISDSDPCITPDDIMLIQELIDAHVESQEQVLAAYAPVGKKTIILDDVTAARLIQVAEENGESINLFSAEGDIVPRLLSKSDTRFAKLVMRGYDHEQYNYQKYNKDYTLRHPSVSMMILTQPDFALRLYQNTYIKELGLTQRIIPWFFDSGFHLHLMGDKFEIMPDICDKYNAKIKTLLDRFYTQDKNAPLCFVTVDSGVRNKVDSYLNNMQMDATRQNYGRGWFAKAGARAIRLACAIHFWNSDDPWNWPINDDEIFLGAQLVQAISYHADFMYSPRGFTAVKPAERIMALLNSIGYPARQELAMNGITSTVIQQRTSLAKEATLNALDLLASCGHIALLDGGKPYVTVIVRN